MKIEFEFNADALKKRQEMAKHLYLSNEERGTLKGALVVCSGDYPLQWLQNFQKLLKDGYTLYESGDLIAVGPTYNRCYMVKPEKIQKAELKEIFERIEGEYLAELEVLKQQHIESIAQQTIAMKKKARLEELAKLEADELESARAEAAALFEEVA